MAEDRGTPEDDRGPDHATPEGVELARVVEREKTLRTFWIGLFTVIGVSVITYGVVTALDQPAWLTAILAVLTALFGPSA